MGKKNIVVVGGGSAGVAAAKGLSNGLDAAQYEVILINPLPYRIWLPATLRLVVSPQEGLKEQAMLPYDKIFTKPNARFVQGTVASFTHSKEGGGSVTLESGETIDYHVLLLSNGSTWSGPPAFPSTEKGVNDHIDNFRAQFAKAKNIAIVGGGAVGFELAGEIKDIWPDKPVTIVHGGEELFNPAYPAKMRTAAAAALKGRGVELVLNDFLDVEETKEVQGVTTRSGRQLKNVDFVVQARGPRANTGFVAASLGADALSATGFVLVRPTLQLKAYDDIFAAGDTMEWKEQKQAAKAGGHGGLVAQNIIAFLNKGTLKEYKGAMEAIVLTNGKDAGLTYLDMLWGIMLGNWFSRMVKSRGLLLGLFKADQRY